MSDFAAFLAILLRSIVEEIEIKRAFRQFNIANQARIQTAMVALHRFHLIYVYINAICDEFLRFNETFLDGPY